MNCIQNEDKFPEVDCGYIQLTKGQFAIVDLEDFDFIKENTWYAKYDDKMDGYYAYRGKRLKKPEGKYKQKTIFMHREIAKRMLIEEKNIDLFVDFLSNPRKFPVDHINHNTLDNKRCNLRVVTFRQNNQNVKKKGTSKYKGVSWDSTNKKWYASIKINGKTKNLGRFEPTPEGERKAAKAYERACREQGEELVCKISKPKCLRCNDEGIIEDKTVPLARGEGFKSIPCPRCKEVSK